ncbi:MAG: hypothetical protein CMN73_04340 [Sphingomonas sp.]|nr:hypothetical protein [Sphingomonas sp.]|tara:strand:+ start:987 stop:1325 length:339 start_codon:yes stop_codon:yes gene_type:complete
MTGAGDLDQRIAIEQSARSKDALRNVVETWGEVGKRWANVNFGKGSERRDAGLERASAPATFRVRWDSLTSAITPGEYRLSYLGDTWDVTSAVRYGRNRFIDITAMRNIRKA